jgi:hypothetical protein
MSKIIFSILLSLIICGLIKSDLTPAKLKIYKLDLDLPVSDRYTQVLSDFKDEIIDVARSYEKLPAYADLVKIADQVTDQDKDWLNYTRAVAKITGLTIGEAVMLSSTYELGCTSALIRDDNNQIIFGRNLDFKTREAMTHAVYQAEYYRRGKLVYKGGELAGFYGAINAVKPGEFAVSLNLRYSDKKTNIQRIFDGYRTPDYHLMKVIESAETFEDAVRMLSEYSLTASVYYIISSLDEGVIITRDNNKVVRVDKLEGDKWFIVLTNTDLDKPENYRRKPTEDRIRELGRSNATYESIFDIMKQPPTNNKMTVYTTIQTASGHFDTTVWLS